MIMNATLSRRLLRVFSQFLPHGRQYSASRFPFSKRLEWSKLSDVREHCFCTTLINTRLHRHFQSTSAQSHVKESSEFPIDIPALESSLPAGPRRIMGKALLDAWVERLTDIAKSGRVNIAKAELDWDKLFERCQALDQAVNKANFGGILMNSCLKFNSYAVAQNYMQHERNPTLAALTNFMKLTAENIDACRGEEDIIKLYQSVKAKNGNKWDLDTGERTITAICRTKMWRDSFSIIKSMSIGGVPTITCYATLARAAFENGEFELGWKILKEQSHRYIPDEPFVAFLRNCLPTEESMKQLLEFMDLHEQYGHDELVSAIKEYFSDKLGYKVRTTGITTVRPGVVICESCQTQLRSNALSESEFNLLQQHFLTRVLEAEDIFINTTPEELKAYRQFVEERLPFDVVVDGLNVAFCKGRNNGAAVLRQVVLHLNRMRAQTLVIGRKHMLQWPVKYMNHVRRMSRFYAINDESEDDPFMIWAALKSGPQTRFISNDMLRNHTFRLKDPELARLFKRWKLSAQLTVTVNHYGKVILEPFAETLPVPQKDPKNGYWHVPHSIDSTSPYDFPKKWFCIKPTQ